MRRDGSSLSLGIPWRKSSYLYPIFHEGCPSNTYGSPRKYLSPSNYLYENKGSTQCSYDLYWRGFNPKKNGRKSRGVGSLSTHIN